MAFNRVERIDESLSLRRVLISVYDKTGLEDFVRGLIRINPELEIYSTGGSYEYLKKVISDIGKGKLISVADYTGQPEMQGGLVKTLDFKIYLGILSEPYNQAHDQDRERVGAILFDMVCVNLYPFALVLAKTGADAEELRQNIDIGGPCMLRASAKAYLRVASVCDPHDYPELIRELDASFGKLSLSTRKNLAAKTFKLVSGYDTAVALWFAQLADPCAAYKVEK